MLLKWLGSNGCGPEPHGEPGYSSYFESSFTAETCSDPPEHNYVLPNTKTDVQHAREHVWWTCFDGHAAGRRRRQATTDCAHAAAGCEAPQRRPTPLHLRCCAASPKPACTMQASQLSSAHAGSSARTSLLKPRRRSTPASWWAATAHASWMHENVSSACGRTTHRRI